MTKNNHDFKYNYSAPTLSERKEIESIRRSYLPENNSVSKLSYLRKLDNKVKNYPTITSLAMGIISLLIFGLGITMVIEWKIVIWGVLVGLVGLVIMLLVYPIFLKLTNYLKNKYSEEILKISEELLNDENK
ncbi:MAG: hypothetical protein IJW32_00190 [Clostridia bacterium]|nr:hypothetical protein [Clostridia bacterium]